MLKTYAVTITPKFPSYFDQEETIEFEAKTGAEAIKKARRMVRNNGRTRQDGPLYYKAKKAS